MEPQFYPFRPWLKANGISPTTGYRLVKEGELHLSKIRSRSYIAAAEAKRFEESLQKSA